MPTKHKPRIVVELESGEYLVSVHPSGTYAWKSQGDGTFIGHGVKTQRSGAYHALRGLDLPLGSTTASMTPSLGITKAVASRISSTSSTSAGATRLFVAGFGRAPAGGR